MHDLVVSQKGWCGEVRRNERHGRGRETSHCCSGGLLQQEWGSGGWREQGSCEQKEESLKLTFVVESLGTSDLHAVGGPIGRALGLASELFRDEATEELARNGGAKGMCMSVGIAYQKSGWRRGFVSLGNDVNLWQHSHLCGDFRLSCAILWSGNIHAERRLYLEPPAHKVGHSILQMLPDAF